MRLAAFTLCLLLLTQTCPAQQPGERVRLNQTGFYPRAPKQAVLASGQGSSFYLSPIGSPGDTLYKGTLSAPRNSAYSDKTTRIADFSAFRKPGSYVLHVPGLGSSYPFDIQANVHRSAAIASLKGLYFQRVSVPLTPEYAGEWTHAAGHPDTEVMVHPSAASEGRPAGTLISAPGGWYDAGDYNKYIVNSGITMGTLLSLYEDFPALMNELETRIPESGNGVPDLLDEVYVNLSWMLAMQDPGDGGVYHKLTNAEFSDMVSPPARANAPRYVVQKSTAATLDFAAVLAQAARVYRPFDKQFPGLADKCLSAARRAWDWAKAHPAVLYEQDEMNRRFDPDVVTGAYGDGDVKDEWIWAATELYVSTGEESYYPATLFPNERTPVPSWSDVEWLGYYTLLRHGQSMARARQDLPTLRSELAGAAERLLEGSSGHYYATVMGGTPADFVWGSSAVAANQGILLIQNYIQTKDRRFLAGALSNLDYLLGRNATGYSFLTGMGEKTPLHPHHRLSESDQAVAPVPGLLAGGPNPGQQDKCETYPSDTPD
ncbi:MAG: cellulase, partial [Bacteroidetes bacterium]